MAAADVIYKALLDVMGKAYAMDNMLTVLEQVNGEIGEPPRWVYMMRDQRVGRDSCKTQQKQT